MCGIDRVGRCLGLEFGVVNVGDILDIEMFVSGIDMFASESADGRALGGASELMTVVRASSMDLATGPTNGSKQEVGQKADPMAAL